MFLLNSCLGLFSAAWSPRLPFSRSYGDILPSSLTMLLPPALGSSPCLPVSVCGTGPQYTIVAFLGSAYACFPTWFRSSQTDDFPVYFDPQPHPSFHRFFHSRLMLRPCVPTCSDTKGHRIINLLSITYASPPRLRSRLPQGRSALPWNPQAFGLDDSHVHLATHSGILSSCNSTTPLGTASSLHQCSPTSHYNPQTAMIPWLR